MGEPGRGSSQKKERLQSFYARRGKRILDVALAACGGLVAAPLIILLSVFVWLDLGRPVFWRQVRPGLGGKLFTLRKFRTMRDEKDADGKLLPDAVRVSRFGSFLRATSLDELPELYNVLKGDMTLVGPRPLRVRYLNRYSRTQARRHEVKPGLTGWAQVNGRNALSWDEKFKLDVWYVDHWSLVLDLKIMGMTVLKVLKREGISADGHATMEEFMGSRKDAKAQR